MKPSAWMYAALMLGVLAEASCAVEAEAPTSVWAATTTPYDPSCSQGCIEIERVERSHMGSFRLMSNPSVDDPIAQWDRCVRGVSDCLVENGTSAWSSCVADSSCPRPCVDAFDRALAELPPRSAFEQTFIDERGLCTPEGVSP